MKWRLGCFDRFALERTFGKQAMNDYIGLDAGNRLFEKLTLEPKDDYQPRRFQLAAIPNP